MNSSELPPAENTNHENAEGIMKQMANVLPQLLKEPDKKNLMDRVYTEKKKLKKALFELLLSEKERFASVFKTEQGSVYFVVDSGQVFRVKISERDNTIEPQNIMKKLYFIAESAVPLLAGQKYDDIYGVPIPVVEFGMGVYPLEVNDETLPQMVVDEIDGTVVLSLADFQQVPNFHLGHKIIEIIK
jgi:hypothetical protein